MKVTLKAITMADYDAILKLTTDMRVMRFIGDRKVWTPEKVRGFIQYCVDDETKPAADRDFFAYKIEVDGPVFAGIIEFKRMSTFLRHLPRYLQARYKGDLLLRIFIAPESQGKGVAKQAIPLLMEKARALVPKANVLVSMVYTDNVPMQSAMPKLGFTYVETIHKEHMLYTIRLKKAKGSTLRRSRNRRQWNLTKKR
jgi:RimJ/RimL family protein N-acetyltransferase